MESWTKKVSHDRTYLSAIIFFADRIFVFLLYYEYFVKTTMYTRGTANHYKSFVLVYLKQCDTMTCQLDENSRTLDLSL